MIFFDGGDGGLATGWLGLSEEGKRMSLLALNGFMLGLFGL